MALYANVQRALTLMAENGFATQVALAEAAGVSERRLSALLNGEPVGAPTFLKLANALGLQGDYSTLIRDKPAKSIEEFDEIKVDPPFTELDGNGINGKPLQDFKVVLADKEVRRRILSGRNLPTFLECVRASAVLTTLDDSYKDHQLIPGTNYNHFFQPSIVVSVRSSTGNGTLAYNRDPKPGKPDNIRTQGLAMLFAADYFGGMAPLSRGPIDKWKRIARERPVDALDALCGSRGVLLNLLKYKIDLIACQPEISPLGVITNDQRSKTCRRVYTQYVFHAVLTTKSASPTAMLAKIKSANLECLEGDIESPETCFQSKSGKPLLMDILAYQGLHGTANDLSREKATFIRGFSVV